MMTDMTSLSWSRGEAARRQKTYKGFFIVILAAEAAGALFAMASPDRLGDFLELANSARGPWLSAWGAVVLFAALLQLPVWRAPVTRRLHNVLVILARIGLATLYFFLWRANDDAFGWLAAFTALSAIGLYILFRKVVLTELQTRP